jgi:hypothetical protein
MEQSRRDGGRNAMTSLVGILIGGAIAHSSLRFSMPIGVPLLLFGLSVMISSIHRAILQKLSPNDFAAGLDELGEDWMTTIQVCFRTADRRFAPLETILYDRLPPRLQKLIPAAVEDSNWFANAFFWRDSKFIFGRKGSGKSMLLAYESWMIKAIYPDAQLYVVDPHLNPKSNWFGGNSELIKAHCYRNSEGIATVFDAVFREFEDRKVKGDLDRPLLKIIADEIEAIVSGYASLPALHPNSERAKELAVYADRIPVIIAAIQDEGRKYQVECTVGAHGGKKGRSGIDGDTLSQMHWIACDDAIAAPNTPLLQVVANGKRLEADRCKLLSLAGQGKKFAGTAVLRCVRTSGVEPTEKAVGLPWITFDLNRIQSVATPIGEVEQWIMDNRDQVLVLYQDGKNTLRKLSDALGMRRSGWQYEALKVLFSQIQKDAHV